MDKKILILFIVWIVGCAVYLSIIRNEFDDYRTERYHQHLNTEYVMSGDTLTIVDYSLVFDTFTLSNGQEISAEIVNKEK